MIWRLPVANAGLLTAARSVAARSVAVRAIIAGCMITGSAAAVPGVLLANTALASATAAASAGTPLYAFNSGLALTVSVRPRSGAWVRVEPYRGSAGQRWVVGKYQTLRPAADQNLCLNVPGGRYRGAKLQLRT